MDKDVKRIISEIRACMKQKKPRPFQHQRAHPIKTISDELKLSRRCLYLFMRSSNPSFKTVYMLANYFNISLYKREF